MPGEKLLFSMIESLIFYNSCSGLTYDFLGKKPKISGINNFSEYAGALFQAMSISKNAEIIEENFKIKSKNKQVVCSYSKSLMTEITKGDLGLVGMIIPEKSNIFIDTMAQIYSLLKDESEIIGVDYDELLNDFENHFSKNIKSSAYFKNYRLKTLRKDFGNYSKTLLSSINKIYGTKTSFYYIVNDLLNEQKELINYSMLNKKKLINMIKNYNSLSETKLSADSSIISDYGKMEKIFGIISPLILHDPYYGIGEYYNFENASRLLRRINKRFLVGESQISELNQAIDEITSFN